METDVTRLSLRLFPYTRFYQDRRGDRWRDLSVLNFTGSSIFYDDVCWGLPETREPSVPIYPTVPSPDRPETRDLYHLDRFLTPELHFHSFSLLDSHDLNSDPILHPLPRPLHVKGSPLGDPIDKEPKGFPHTRIVSVVKGPSSPKTFLRYFRTYVP